ncbi:MAG: hypothetical protein DME57_10025 [Verrucomicrobia bacterium]|nr:MAG: hypothetical protein DME57_10025 [Verrucomicrobiota bacterium]
MKWGWPTRARAAEYYPSVAEISSARAALLKGLIGPPSRYFTCIPGFKSAKVAVCPFTLIEVSFVTRKITRSAFLSSAASGFTLTELLPTLAITNAFSLPAGDEIANPIKRITLIKVGLTNDALIVYFYLAKA